MIGVKSKKLPVSKTWLIIVTAIILLLGGGVVGLRSWYQRNLQPVSSSAGSVYFTVAPGSGLHTIADKLKRADLIRNARAFETYVRSHELHDKLQAGTYTLSPSMGIKQIVGKIVNGEVTKNLLTILPQKRLDEIKQSFVKAGYSQRQIETAFNPDTYAGHPALSGRPAGATLEGYLYPDSYEKLTDTPPQTIIRESLDEMNKHLTADILNGFAAQGLTAYRGVILASIIAQETDDPSFQPMVAQVFLSRLKQGMALQSNVTANYAADVAGQPRNIGIDSPYNTYLHNDLPPGPISNVNASALDGAAHPASTDYLYFVAGDDNKIHFSRTQAEHDDAVKKYCVKKCIQ
ncbi:endolytic transglycosylase MltG [Candidatus Saccharibacteria bacterium]|nr:endolytic transglycosylase MltG [Candidatus Saccharibacteria bacterium]